MKGKLRYIIGGLLIILGLTLKSLLTHNIEYWGIVKTWTILLFIVGMVFLLLNLLLRFDIQPEISFLKTPIKWLAQFLRTVVILVVIVGISVCFENLGSFLNRKLKNHYLSFDTEKGEGTLISIKTVTYRIKRAHEKRFYLIEYNTDNRTIQQGLDFDEIDSKLLIKKSTVELSNNADKLNVNNLIGLKFTVEYSKKYPSFFRVVEE
jgi:hypothetical protein